MDLNVVKPPTTDNIQCQAKPHQDRLTNITEFVAPHSKYPVTKPTLLSPMHSGHDICILIFFAKFPLHND